MNAREKSLKLLDEYISSESLKNHCRMVARAMEFYAKKFRYSDAEVDEWWSAGLLHDLDWERYPEQHPNYATEKILPEMGYSLEIINAIKSHAPSRTGYTPTEEIDKYLFACDEISGFIHAVSLVRPNGLQGLEPKSVLKRLKEKSFASNVSREDILEGVNLINLELDQHVANLIEAFS